MSGPIEEEYFDWLCAKVLSHQDRSYRDLLEILHRTEFVWVVLGDRNREEGGRELKTDFLRDTNYMRDRSWFECPSSVLEVLLKFAHVAAFQTDMPVKDWFWRFIANLELEEYKNLSEDDVSVIQEILNTFIWRTYRPNGCGGLFPMRFPKHDQRKVEIWYQFCEYVEEQNIL